MVSIDNKKDMIVLYKDMYNDNNYLKINGEKQDIFILEQYANSPISIIEYWSNLNIINATNAILNEFSKDEEENKYTMSITILCTCNENCKIWRMQ